MNKKIIVLIIGLIIALIGIIIFIYSNPKVAVLCYHNIATKEEKSKFPDEQTWTIDVENFEEQLKYLQKHNYKTITTKEFIAWKNKKIELPYKSVLITFDDGFLSNYQYAFPLLKKYNMNAVVFLVGEYIEKGDKEWTGNIQEYLTYEIIEKCKDEYPNIEFASHSFGLHYHKSIEEKTEQEMTNDLKKFNQEIIDTKVYAYPFGAKNDKIKGALKNNDYEIGFIYGPTKKEYRKASRKDEIYEIPRLNMSYGMGVRKFGLRLLMPF